jgi:Zn/Cd-binding protein ZinT
MKKFKVFLVSLLTIVMSLFCFASCGVEGTYKFESLTVQLIGTTTIKVGDEYLGQEVTEDFMTITLNKDNTVSFSRDGEDSDGTWEKGEDGHIIITVGGMEIDAVKDGKKLTFSYSGLGEIVLTK